ncbi:unnamed protein product, partial [Discosporangium mesarthrocarpum]
GEGRHPGWGFGYNGADPRVGFVPQIWYDQQNAVDYKRCSIFISDTRATAHAQGLLALAKFFAEPVHDFREVDRALRPERYTEVRPTNLDLEVVLTNTFLCLPEKLPYPARVPRPFDPSKVNPKLGTSVGRGNEVRAISVAGAGAG